MYCTLREWQLLEKDRKDLIVQASSVLGDDAWQDFPIGMSWQYGKVDAPQFGSHENLLLCAVNTHTDSARRPSGLNRIAIVSTLEKNSFQNTVLEAGTYFSSLPTYKFIASPEGNGIDCHRHYEALIAGCIPIVEHNPLVELKYRDCPVLYTTDYSEITPSYLEGIYNEWIDREWDFSRLFLSYYEYETQTTIKQFGNYWMNCLTGSNWY